MMEHLRSSIWKIKSAALSTIAEFGPRCSAKVLPLLIKILGEYSVNKQAVAEIILKIGEEGERALIKYLNQSPDSDFKLKSCVLKSLGLVDLKSQNIDLIVEVFLKYFQ